jgi:nucleoid DNA-binding protein
MYKRDFVTLIQSALLDRFNDRFGGRLSREDADEIVKLIFEVITDAVESGDEVRILPFGRFYAKIMRRRSTGTISSKLGFSSYKKTDRRLTKNFDFTQLEDDPTESA